MIPKVLHAGPAAPEAALAYDPARDEMVDVTNLPREDTGLAGTIFISTRLAAHGPRIKWYPGRPGREAPCLTVTLEDPPRAINLGLPAREARQAQGPVLQWARLNRDALLDYWDNGVTWTRQELNAFIDGLAKLP